jgi:hypothetical protein
MSKQSMPYLNHKLLAITLLLASPALLLADYVTINSTNGDYDMYAGNADGLLDNSDHQFSLSDQEVLAAILNNDGIETVGKLSFILASADAGLSFIGLFDGIPFTDPSSSLADQYLGVSSTTSTETDWFATGDIGSYVGWYDMGNSTQLVNAMLGWDQGLTSAGFAWGDLESSPSGTVNLFDISLTEFADDSIQFLTYQDDQWAVAGTADFSVLGQYAFSYQLVPAPGAFALLAMAGLVGARRRRN